MESPKIQNTAQQIFKNGQDDHSCGEQEIPTPGEVALEGNVNPPSL